jgi:molecular chaperone DnaJ
MDFNGKDVIVDMKVSFREALNGAEKKIIYKKETKCRSCKGAKEEAGSKSSQCYSCKGEGIKKDPLFQKETKCNTCHGHGYLVVNPCKTC